MRTHKFLDDVQHAARANNRIFAIGDRTQRNWPLCLTCGRDVDEAGLKNVTLEGVEIWARCRHLSKDCSDLEYERAKVFEDYYRSKFPFRLDNVDPHKDERVQNHIRRAMGDGRFFDPTIPPK